MASVASNLSFVLQAPQKLVFEDRPVPELASPRDVIVRPAWTGICGSDVVHYWLHGRIGNFVVKSPMTLGHESSGVVHAIGDAVKGLSVGDRVAMEPGVPCRYCSFCKSGSYNLCKDMAFAATPPYDGTLCKYYSLPADFCYKLPENLSLEAGALIEPVAVAVHVVKQGEVTAGDSVVVFGAGPVGLLIGAVARAFGASKIVMVDIVEKRLEFAKSWVSGGCGVFVPSKNKSAQENAEALIKDHGLGEGADVVLEASGAVSSDLEYFISAYKHQLPVVDPEILEVHAVGAASSQTAVWVCKRGGTFVQGGMGADDITFPIMGLCNKEITAKGSFRYKEGDYALAVALVSNGMIEAEKLISGKVRFDEAEQAFERVKRGEAIKMLIEGVKN